MMNYSYNASSFSMNNGSLKTSKIINFMKQKSHHHQRPDIGDLKWSVGKTDNNRWLICDGRSLLIANYQPLYAVIGTEFGGDGVNTFNIPDCRSRVLGAIGQGDGLSNRIIGDMVGEETHTLTIPEIPSHNHNGITGSYTHNHGGVTGNGGNQIESETVVGTVAAIHSDALVSGSGVHNHSIASDTHTHSISSQGGSLPHNNMQPTIFIGNVFIYSG